ncbi:hypothetical protein GBA52_014831 [Prunus armeniaca]|nr:hypothetical protein GBA52_014831 [Prunus armeniaca]
MQYKWCWKTRGSGNATELEAAFRTGSILHPNQRIILKRKKRLISKSVGRMDENEKIESTGQEIGHAQGSGKAVASDSQTFFPRKQ